MYRRQIGLISDQQKYFGIVDRFFTKAEQELKAIEFCKNAPDSALAQQYIIAVSNLNVLIFRERYAGGAGRFLSVIKGNLQETLKKISESEEVREFDVKAEFARTIKLIEEGNTYYYNQLSPFNKGLLGFAKLF